MLWFYRLRKKMSRVKLLVSDFDGVMTDGCVYVSEDGREMVKCSRRDGLGIELLRQNGIETIVLSKEINPVVEVRCQKLKVKCWQALKDGGSKVGALKTVLQENGLDKGEVCYIGDDINDLEAMNYIGVAVTVADGHQELKRIADYITVAPGGSHAIRELAEIILEAKGIELKI